jgi:serine-type D-Ala-D-Ala carboxypeptidase/endopeptidase (penicillin-binding protein 4)
MRAPKALPRRAPLVLFVVALVGLAVGRDARADRPAASAAPARPTLQPENLQHALAGLQRWVHDQKGVVSAAILDVASGRVLASVSADLALNPASNAKLVTTAAALKLLGPNYRYVTGIYGHLHDGTVDGLVLRGHGDPSLTTADLWDMGFSLVAMGLRRVDGVLVDQSRFDDQFVPPAFNQEPNEWAYFRAPVSAVALERNAVTMNVLPRAAGQSARVWFDPPGFVRVSGSVATVDKGKGQDIKLTLQPAGALLDAQVSGHIAEDLPRLRFARRVDDPRLFPGYVFAFILRSLGVHVSGSIALGGEHEHERLVFHESHSLATLIRQLGKNSDNYYAETLFKTIGGEVKGPPATSAAGAEVVLDWLKQVGALEPSTKIINGSGLFNANRESASTFVRVLRAAYQDSAIGPEFLAQLSIGGVDGTLHSRFRKYADRRCVRAKTGTLDKAIALSGYVLGPPGNAPIAFSIVVDGIEAHRAVRRRIDRVVAQVVDGLWSS